MFMSNTRGSMLAGALLMGLGCQLDAPKPESSAESTLPRAAAQALRDVASEIEWRKVSVPGHAEEVRRALEVL